MGITYKLKPELKEYILTEKKAQPILSCRRMMSLISQKFQARVSKSTINSLFKETGLSMPVGRTRKKRRRKHQIPVITTPQIAMKSEILLLEAQVKTPEITVEKIVEEPAQIPIKKPAEMPVKEPEIAILLKVADYLIGGSVQIPHLFKEVAGIKVILSNGAVFYLDGQLHTVWSRPHIPADFSTTIYNIKSYINKYFKEDQPFILLSSPGYATPTKEFFDFILSLDAAEKSIAELTLYDLRLKEIESISLGLPKKRYFVFGLWPWQFGQYRSVKSMGQFGQFYFEPLKEGFYLAEIEVELLQPTINKRVILKGCALKTNLNAQIRLIILSNLAERITCQELTSLYLSHWPNLEEGFQDFSQKIELSTYKVSSGSFFSPASLNSDIESSLDLYFRRYFLPSGYENKDFSTMKEQFYNLPTHLQPQKDYLLVTFNPAAGWPFLKDLEYALRRINEREILFADGKRLWFSL